MKGQWKEKEAAAAVSCQDTGVSAMSRLSVSSLRTCVRALRIESECVTEQEVRQTDVSLTQNILQTRRVQPPPSHTGCVTHSFHFLLDVGERASPPPRAHTYRSTRRLLRKIGPPPSVAVTSWI